MRKLLIITGPTAVGKTKIAINLAKKINGEIISCDSMQIYKNLNIGSAKATEEEMEGIEHHLIDIKSPFENFDASMFKELCVKKIDEILNRERVPILTGGTMMYIDSVINDYDFTDAVKDDEYRKYLSDLADDHGKEYVHSLLKDKDIESYNSIPFNNLKRVIRALEVYKLTKKTIGEYKLENLKKSPAFDYRYIVLNMNRECLYNRINSRIDKMLEDGLVDEVIGLKNMGLTTMHQSMQGIGYKEVLEYLDGKMEYDAMVLLIKKRSRNYAKRQLTWFRNVKNSTYINIDEETEFNIIKKIICLYET